MLFVSMVDYHLYARIQKVLFAVGIALLILVLIPGVGKTHNNATRWIQLPVIGEFQPSELMKTAVILSFSYYAAKAGQKIRTLRYGLLPYIGALGVIAFLLYREPHLSATIIILGLGLCILFVAGIKIWYFFPMGGAAACAFALAYNTDRLCARARPYRGVDQPVHRPEKQGVAGRKPSFVAHRFGRPVGRWPRAGAPKAPVSAGAAERFHFLVVV